ncbi:MAG: hypothetical protein AAF747_09130 [Planctomycetota bacterium]
MKADRPAAPSAAQKSARLVFVTYAIVLATATHWPGVVIKSDLVSRPDIFIHLAAFSLWTVLLGFTGWCGVLSSARNAVVSAAAGSTCGMLDEVTQRWPIHVRVFDWADLAANIAGGVVGGLVLLLVARRGASV